METLPEDIERKLEKLPVVSFDASDELPRVLATQDFIDIFNYYKEHFLPDVLKSQPEIYQKVSLYLTLTGQDTAFANQTDQVLFRRPVPTMEEFLNDDFYHGKLTATMYPYWKEQLCNIFRENSPVRKVIFGGSIGCLSKDTVIATLHGNKTIETLLQDFSNEWVLSYNVSNNSWEPDKIIDVFYTGIKKVYRITLDNGKTIDCTSNHRFLTRNNKWVSIDNGLQPGLSMMPYYYEISKDGYTLVKDNKTEKFVKRYNIVGNWKIPVRKGRVIHHKNFDKTDDRPQNLCNLDHKEHWKYHAKKGGIRWKIYNQSISGDDFKEYHRNKALKAAKTYKAKENYKELEKIRKRGWIASLQDKEHQAKAGKAAWNEERFQHHLEVARNSIIAYNTSEKGRETSRKNAIHMHKVMAEKSDEEKKLIKLKIKLSSLKRHRGKDNIKYIETLKLIHEKEPWYDPEVSHKENEKRKKNWNHKIVSIEYIGEKEVFDITTEKNHNFALEAGIVAHNSGKSTIARKAIVYSLYRALCLRYPRAAFNVDEDTTLANFIVSVTIKQVFDTNLMPFVSLLNNMPCFQSVRHITSFDGFNLDDPYCPIPFWVEKSSGTIFFPNNFILSAGSQVQHTIGYSIINSFCFTEDTKVYTNKGILTFKELENRFKNNESFTTKSITNTKKIIDSNITNVQITGYKQDFIKIYITDTDYIECTPEHPFVIANPKENDHFLIYENGIPYKYAKDLTEEDELEEGQF